MNLCFFSLLFSFQTFNFINTMFIQINVSNIVFVLSCKEAFYFDKITVLFCFQIPIPVMCFNLDIIGMLKILFQNYTKANLFTQHLYPDFGIAFHWMPALFSLFLIINHFASFIIYIVAEIIESNLFIATLFVSSLQDCMVILDLHNRFIIIRLYTHYTQPHRYMGICCFCMDL